MTQELNNWQATCAGLLALALDGAKLRGAADYARSGAVEPRTTSSGENKNSSALAESLEICLTSNSMIILPIGSIGCRTVVSGGSVQFISAESS
jgi:hypothetical protein